MIDDATVLDSVDKFRIVIGHPSGPVLEYYGLKAIISEEDAQKITFVRCSCYSIVIKALV